MRRRCLRAAPFGQTGEQDMDSKTRSTAEARFERARKATEAGKAAWSAYETDARAVEAKTARLKAARLARDEAGPAAGEKKPRAARKSAVRKGVGSY